MDQKFLSEAILGNRPELFDQIWPVYKQFLEATNAGKLVETYFLDRSRLINDFFRWLHQEGHADALALIDRRSGTDRRGGQIRVEAPGRRLSDVEKAKAAANPFRTSPTGEL